MKRTIALFAIAGSALISLPAEAAPLSIAESLVATPGFALVQYRSEEEPDHYPTGSTAWWRAMDRDGRGGFR